MNALRAQRFAKSAGVLVLISIFAGGFAEVYVPGKLLMSDPAMTARNIAGSALLFRSSFAVYLVEAVCDISLTLIFYVLLRPVNRYISLLAAFFGLVSTATFAVAEMCYFVASLPLFDVRVAKALDGDQRTVFVFVALTSYGYLASIFMLLYGIATTLRGYLVYRSGYLPRLLGTLLVAAGISFVVKNFLVVLSPRYDSDLLALPMFVAIISVGAWLLARGIDQDKWVWQPLDESATR